MAASVFTGALAWHNNCNSTVTTKKTSRKLCLAYKRTAGLSYVCTMPNYRITIYMKIGEPKKGIRYFPSHDIERVRFLVGQKVRETLGNFTVERIEVEMMEEDRRNMLDM